MRLKLACPRQVIYTSSMADQASVEVLRQSTGCEGTPKEYEVHQRGMHACPALQRMPALTDPCTALAP